MIIQRRGHQAIECARELSGTVALFGIYTLVGVGLIALFQLTSPHPQLTKCVEIAKVAAPITALALTVLSATSLNRYKAASLILN